MLERQEKFSVVVLGHLIAHIEQLRRQHAAAVSGTAGDEDILKLHPISLGLRCDGVRVFRCRFEE